MSYILHIETATKVCSVALSKNGELVTLKEMEEDGYSHGENLTLFIQAVVAEAEIKLSDLSAISIASGPGSYTGLRIGAATAKGLCYALNISLIAIDALVSLVEQAKVRHPSVNLCALIDARRMEVYNLFVSKVGEPLKNITADIIDEQSYENFLPFVYFGDGAEKLQEIWGARDCSIDGAIKSSAKGQIKLAFEKFKNQDFVDVAYWEPFYLKDFVAGVKKVD